MRRGKSLTEINTLKLLEPPCHWLRLRLDHFQMRVGRPGENHLRRYDV